MRRTLLGMKPTAADTYGLHSCRSCVIRLLPSRRPRKATVPDPEGSTTVLKSMSQDIIRSPANVHTSDRAVVAAARAPGARRPWRWMSAHGVQAVRGVPRGLKPLGRRAGRRKDRGAGGERLARSAARKAYAAIHNAPW